jgi:hypothetical protein
MATQPTADEETMPSRAVALSPQRESYAIMKDQARLFSISRLLPEAVRGSSPEEAMANCLIALQMAQAMDELPFMVMQNIHIVRGKAGFAAQFMIARANASGVFKSRINWDINRDDPNNLSVTAYAYLADTGERVEFTVDMKMAAAEKWTANEKYKSIPELMLRYRSATFLVRLYAPDVMLGYRTADELEDMGAAEAPSKPRLTGDMLIDQARPQETVAGEVIEAEASPAAETVEEPAAVAKSQADRPARASRSRRAEETPPAQAEPAATQAEERSPAPEHDGKSPSEEACERIIAEINEAAAIIDVNSIVSRHGRDIEAMDDTLVVKIEIAADKRKNAIRLERENVSQGEFAK